MTNRTADSQDPRKPKSQDYVGLALFAVGAFATVSIVMHLLGQTSAKWITKPVNGLLFSLGDVASLLTALALGALGAALYVRQTVTGAGRHLLGIVGVAIGLSVVMGGIFAERGGEVGAILPAMIGATTGLFVSVAVGLSVLLASAWIVWLGGTPFQRSKPLTPSALVPPRRADADGVSAAEAQALQQESDTSIRSELPTPPLDVRIGGGVPDGTAPLQSSDDLPQPTQGADDPFARDFDQPGDGANLATGERPGAHLAAERAPNEPVVSHAGDAPASGGAALAEAPALDATPAPDGPVASWERADDNVADEAFEGEPVELAAEADEVVEDEAYDEAAKLEAPEDEADADAEYEDDAEYEEEDEDEEYEEAAELEEGEEDAEEEDGDEYEYEEAAELEEGEEDAEEEDEDEYEEAAELEGDEEDAEEEDDGEYEYEEAAELEEDDEDAEAEEDEEDEEYEEAAELDEAEFKPAEALEPAALLAPDALDAAEPESTETKPVAAEPEPAAADEATLPPAAAWEQVGLFDDEPTAATADHTVLVPAPKKAKAKAKAKPKAKAKAKGKPRTPKADIAAASSSVSNGTFDRVFEAGALILEENRVAVSMLQRRFSIDFDEACELLDKLGELGLIGPYVGGRNRDILLTREEWDAMADVVAAST